MPRDYTQQLRDIARDARDLCRKLEQIRTGHPQDTARHTIAAALDRLQELRSILRPLI